MEDLKRRIDKIEVTTEYLSTESTRHTESIRGIWHKINSLEALEQNILCICQDIREMFTEIKHLREDNQAMRKDLEDIKSRDGKQWRNFIGILMTVVISAIIGKYLI